MIITAEIREIVIQLPEIVTTQEIPILIVREPGAITILLATTEILILMVREPGVIEIHPLTILIAPEIQILMVQEPRVLEIHLVTTTEQLTTEPGIIMLAILPAALLIILPNQVIITVTGIIIR
jgi:hypothetical protein